MLMQRTSRRGLGADYRINSSGTIVDCDLWSNLFQGVCWGAPTGTLPSGVNAGDSASDLPQPAVPCSSTLITSPIAVCDWIVYSAGAALLLGMVFMFGGRR
jgi:hypothetical protein